MRELFIYFRAPVANEARLTRDLPAMQRALCQDWPGLQARCLRRPDAKDGQHTWMETYASTQADGVTESMQASIAEAARSRLAPLGIGERHIEVFMPCPA